MGSGITTGNRDRSFLSGSTAKAMSNATVMKKGKQVVPDFVRIMDDRTGKPLFTIYINSATSSGVSGVSDERREKELRAFDKYNARFKGLTNTQKRNAQKQGEKAYEAALKAGKTRAQALKARNETEQGYMAQQYVNGLSKAGFPGSFIASRNKLFRSKR